MATGPADELGAAARGRLRASHADREQVIGVLKAAFVQGRLTKDELGERAGQVFAARTYAELAVLTADLPAGTIGAVPDERAARMQARRPMGHAAKSGIWAVLAVVVPVMVSFGTGSTKIFLVLTPFYLMSLAVLSAPRSSSHGIRSAPIAGSCCRGPRPVWAVSHSRACRQPVRPAGFRQPAPVRQRPPRRSEAALPAWPCRFAGTTRVAPPGPGRPRAAGGRGLPPAS